MKDKRKTILLLGAGEEQCIAINVAKSIGLRVIAADGNPQAKGLKMADVGINVDINDVKKLVELGQKYTVDGIFCHAVEIPVVVAKVAKKLRLPGLSPEIAERATDKIKRIKCFAKKGVPCAKFETASSTQEALTKAKKIGFPVVIKPVDNAGARGVKKLYSEKEVKEAFNEALQHSKKKTVLIEELLEGREISTETVIHKCRNYHTGYGDRNYSRNREFHPYFVEDGHHVPGTLSKKDEKRMWKIVENAIKALGIKWGVAKGDILISKNKIYVLEMACRTSGGWFAAGTVPIATGVNIMKPLMKMSLGESFDVKDVQPLFQKAACQRYIIPTEKGYFEKFEGIDDAVNMPGVEMFVLFKKPKQGELIKKSTNNAERFGQLITQGKNVRDAIEKCEYAMKKIKIKLRAAK